MLNSFRARVDFREMVINGYSAFPKAPVLVSPSDYLVSYKGHSSGKSYPSAEMQSVYSAAPVDGTI